MLGKEVVVNVWAGVLAAGMGVTSVVAGAISLLPSGGCYAETAQGAAPSGEGSGLWVIDADGSNPRRLVDVGGEDLQWSPDGSRFAFVSGEQIHLMNVDGSGRRALTEGVEYGQDPAWSPDGTKIAFTSYRDQVPADQPLVVDPEIYVMNPDGSGKTRLTHDQDRNQDPSWSPDGTKIVFTTSVGGDNRIEVMNVDGSGREVVTSDSLWYSDPDWAPGSVEIAFTATRRPDHEIWISLVRADGTGERSLTKGCPLPNVDGPPAFSPDGTKILFENSNRDASGINVIDADGSSRTRLTGGGHSPAWSPDGAQIAFFRG